MRVWLCAAAVVSALAVIACGAPQPHDDSTQVEEVTGVHQCEVSKSVERPMLVEWPAVEKAALQTNAATGVVVVRYDGCRLKMLPRCHLDGAYEFTETSRSKDSFTISEREELYAKLPLGAVSLEGELAKGNTLSLSYTIMGMRTANIDETTVASLTGDCRGATHFVRGMVVGAYRLSRESMTIGGGQASAGPAGAGGEHGLERQILKSDGDLQKCSDNEVPAGDPSCQAIVQLDLAPIEGAEKLSEVSSPDSSLSEESSKGDEDGADPGNIEFEKGYVTLSFMSIFYSWGNASWTTWESDLQQSGYSVGFQPGAYVSGHFTLDRHWHLGAFFNYSQSDFTFDDFTTDESVKTKSPVLGADVKLGGRPSAGVWIGAGIGAGFVLTIMNGDWESDTGYKNYTVYGLSLFPRALVDIGLLPEFGGAKLVLSAAVGLNIIPFAYSDPGLEDLSYDYSVVGIAATLGLSFGV